MNVPEAEYAVFTTPPVDTSEGKDQEELILFILKRQKVSPAEGSLPFGFLFIAYS
ncbi:hypothetical protein D3C87_1812960 [compost metagenome]